MGIKVVLYRSACHSPSENGECGLPAGPPPGRGCPGCSVLPSAQAGSPPLPGPPPDASELSPHSPATFLPWFHGDPLPDSTARDRARAGLSGEGPRRDSWPEGLLPARRQSGPPSRAPQGYPPSVRLSPKCSLLPLGTHGGGWLLRWTSAHSPDCLRHWRSGGWRCGSLPPFLSCSAGGRTSLDLWSPF